MSALSIRVRLRSNMISASVTYLSCSWLLKDVFVSCLSIFLFKKKKKKNFGIICRYLFLTFLIFFPAQLVGSLKSEELAKGVLNLYIGDKPVSADAKAGFVHLVPSLFA